MLKLLLPDRIYNFYEGTRLALWLFGTIILMTLAMSLNLSPSATRDSL
jgi:hypothetical protein